MINSIKLVSGILQNFLSERYQPIVDEILSRKLENQFDLTYRKNGISFNTILDELVFVILYENESFNKLKKILQFDIEEMVNELIKLEDSILQSIGIELTEKKQVDSITQNIMNIINNQLMIHLSELSYDRYIEFVDEIIKDIKEFAFDGSVVGDYDTSDYWEEFCLILQEGYDDLYDICHDDIYSYILGILENTSNSILRILFTGTDEFDRGNIDDLLNSIEIEYIADKLINTIRDKASMEDIEHILYPDEYED